MTVNLDQHTRLAEDLVAAYNAGETEAVARLNNLFHSSITAEQIRHFVRDRLMFLPGYEEHPFDVLTLADAQQLFASIYGFRDWPAFVRSSNEPPRDLRSAPIVLSSTPPFYRIDWTHKSIEPRQPMSNKDWEDLFAVVKEFGLTTVNAMNQIGDDDLEKLSQLDHVTSLDFSGSQFITDKGLQQLAHMPQLRELRLNHYPGGAITDRGLEVLQNLRELRVFQICWQSGITDNGIANLRHCEHLEEVDLLGTQTGDDAIAALTGKPKLRKFKTGRNVTDDGLARLHDFPAFKMWSGDAPQYGLMSFGAEPTNLLVDGSFTRAGLKKLRGLEGLFSFSFFRHTSGFSGNDLQSLAALPNLGYFGCPGEICDDDAMHHISTLPNLRMLMAQGTIATDEGFKRLSRSATIEYIWGRECPNLKSTGFTALAEMPALKGLAVSCKFVDDAGLAKLPAFPALKELMPMDVSDEGFRHVGRCHGLESLVLMYCRDTTDIATEHIQALPRLKKYHAGYIRITDRTLEMLSRMSSLEEVSFEGCKRLTDAGVAALAGLPQLREISFGNCPNVTRDGISAFPTTIRVNYSPH